MPSERELARTFGTARNTAREAVRLLAEEGRVVAEHGRGVFVRQVRPVIRLGSDRYSRRHWDTGLSPYRMECQRLGIVARVDVLDIQRVVPPPEVAQRLDVADDEPSVLQRLNHYFADDEPVQIGTTYIPWADA